MHAARSCLHCLHTARHGAAVQVSFQFLCNMRGQAGLLVALCCTCKCIAPTLHELHESLRHALDHTHLDVALSILDQMGSLHPATLAHEARMQTSNSHINS